MLSPTIYVVFSIRRSRFVKEQEVSGIISLLGIKKPLSQFSLLGVILFEGYKNE